MNLPFRLIIQSYWNEINPSYQIDQKQEDHLKGFNVHTRGSKNPENVAKLHQYHKTKCDPDILRGEG